MIRSANIEDACRIAEIQIFGWRSAYRGIVSDDILFRKLIVTSKSIRLEKSITEGVDNFFVLEEDEIIKGFIICGKSRSEDRPESYELYAIYVEPLMKGLKIGTQLINFFDNIAVQQGYKSSILWVFKENERSRHFYEKNGYSLEGKEAYLEEFNAWEVRYIKFYE
ncbi:MAG TPA: GNAT family N-acetyltransferase [Exilispira sp.]|nr:GNAT family N-acetyltransferase [Exilispira sp.]